MTEVPCIVMVYLELSRNSQANERCDIDSVCLCCVVFIAMHYQHKKSTERLFLHLSGSRRDQSLGKMVPLKCITV